jgi:hypothetical protein
VEDALDRFRVALLPRPSSEHAFIADFAPVMLPQISVFRFLLSCQVLVEIYFVSMKVPASV